MVWVTTVSKSIDVSEPRLEGVLLIASGNRFRMFEPAVRGIV